jgi:hypothetical protein
MTCDGSRIPLKAVAATGKRYNGASLNVVVNKQTSTLSVSFNQSDCMITAGRGFPSSPLIATITMSPRLIPNRRCLQRPR